MRGLLPHHTDPDQDRGSAELVVATPLMLLLLVLVVQVALWAHASQVTQTIAQHGQAAARTLGATEADGHARADEVADQLRGDLLHDMAITVQRTDTTVTVQVSAQVPTMIPGLDWPVRTAVSGPVEHHTPPSGGGP
ncbi:TadE/TadG family type IV pilus assembly protein [Nocardiopsis quinghaiensis]|uniref:TadE/TadG family type IV pilus assembly protein n=1 Tax=Nocardiopsis quinghaiensis TaxID=464995 RepID=UPI001238F4A1|nr:TadE/TadG family type IV pilus assembly protein [Nocardiopsis quinghaiensis]